MSHQRHGPDDYVVADADLVSNDAAIGTEADVFAYAQRVMVQAKGLDADRAILPYQKITPDAYLASDHHTWQMGDTKAWAYLRTDVDIHGVLEVEPLLHAAGISPAQAAATIEVLRQAIGEKKAQLIVLARSTQHVAQQADTASGLFLVGDLLSPAFQQGFEIHDVGPLESATHDAAIKPATHQHFVLPWSLQPG